MAAATAEQKKVCSCVHRIGTREFSSSFNVVPAHAIHYLLINVKVILEHVYCRWLDLFFAIPRMTIMIMTLFLLLVYIKCIELLRFFSFRFVFG